MAKAPNKTICVVCKKERITYPCHGCSEDFCLDHLPEHRTNLGQQLDYIENDHDELRQNLHEQKTTSVIHLTIKEIEQWEQDSIHRIKQLADRYKERLINYSNGFLREIENKLNDLAQQIKEIRRENDFNEIDLIHLKQRLQKLQEELFQPTNVTTEQQSTSFINNISVLIPFHKDMQWKQLGMTIVGGNQLNRLYDPIGICIDDYNQAICIADCGNARIVEWTVNATNGRIVAGGNGLGDQAHQLNHPTDVIIDKENDSFIIADQGNRRVMRWPRQTSPRGEIIIEDIDCDSLTMDKDGSLYVSDSLKNEVRRWKKGETLGTIVAGGNGQGNQLNQLHHPTCIFVDDDDHSLYVADSDNHRVMKWLEDAGEGIVVAGGNGQGNHATQLFCPEGVIVDRFSQIYVADGANARVMRWCEGAKEGTIVVGGNGYREEANQLSGPVGLSFDGEGNLYVADCGNHRIQKFFIN